MRRAALALIPCALFVAAACSRPQAAATSPRPEVRPTAPGVAAAVPSPAAAEHAGHHANNPPPAAAAPSGAPRTFGQPIAENTPRTTLREILAQPAVHTGHPIRVEGTVAAVCQNMGCWMEIRDEHNQAHIRMHGHSFFVPRDISGRHAVVQATLVAAHPPTECDQEAREATGRVAQVELDATGVLVD